MANEWLYALALLGFVLSIYALIVRIRLKRDPRHIPACDLSTNISCSRAFMSPQGALFLIPNPILGMLYYVLFATLLVLNKPLLLIVLASAGVFASLVLAYYLYFEQRNFCVVCGAIYAINLTLFILLIL